MAQGSDLSKNLPYGPMSVWPPYSKTLPVTVHDLREQLAREGAQNRAFQGSGLATYLLYGAS